MFGKDISELNFDDIKYLVQKKQQPEGYYLDYKKTIGNPDKAKNELAKDISSFANSNGGFLIIGIDDDLNIIGADKKINNKPIKEWINQVISANIEPSVFYFDPQIIPIPDSDKIIIVIKIPESYKKPHFVNSKHQYFIRINDSSKPAEHNQIRDMFYLSNIRNKELDDFLFKRKILDIDQENFGNNNVSGKLSSEVTILPKKPKIIFSVIPKYPNIQQLNNFKAIKDWLNGNSNIDNFWLYNANIGIDYEANGIIFLNNYSRENLKYSSYFEVMLNGYIEAGFTDNLFHQFQMQNNSIYVGVNLTKIIGYEIRLIEWYKKFMNEFNLTDEFILQISFVNVLDTILIGLNDKYEINYNYFNSFKNKYNNNFKIFEYVSPKINENDIIEVAKKHSEIICRAYGQGNDLAFVDNKLSINKLNNFW